MTCMCLKPNPITTPRRSPHHHHEAATDAENTVLVTLENEFGRVVPHLLTIPVGDGLSCCLPRFIAYTSRLQGKMYGASDFIGIALNCCYTRCSTKRLAFLLHVLHR